MAELLTYRKDGDIHVYVFWEDKGETEHRYCGKIDKICDILDHVYPPGNTASALEVVESEGYLPYIPKLLQHITEGMSVNDLCSQLGISDCPSEDIKSAWALEPLIERDTVPLWHFGNPGQRIDFPDDPSELDPATQQRQPPTDQSDLQFRTERAEEYSERKTRSRGHDRYKSTVKELYGYQCAFCGLQVEVPKGECGERYGIEVAHIQRAADGGPDTPPNRIALCHFHHWAFDNGWVTLSDDHTIIVEDAPQYEGYEKFKHLEGQAIRLPENPNMHPHSHFLQIHREQNGFEKG